jgi:hypothetical protein
MKKEAAILAEQGESSNCARSGLGCFWPGDRFEMGVNHFARRVFARAAAIRDWESRLNIIQARGTAIQALPNLAITDSVAQTNVHSVTRPLTIGQSKYKCE